LRKQFQFVVVSEPAATLPLYQVFYQNFAIEAFLLHEGQKLAEINFGVVFGVLELVL